MKKTLFILSTLIGISTFAQNKSAVLTVDGQHVSLDEFEAIYKKNNKDADVTKEALDEYMELFINYKLKVREAESLGMDTIGKFQTELAGYRTQLARPYLVDRELNDALIKEAYERRGKEVRASHILVSITGDQTPNDTIAAWNKIMELRKRVTTGGEDFATVAKSKGGSDDPSAKSNGGDLGYFTALQMVYPFENIAYKTPVGEVSEPVRTRFGYHILKVVDTRAARGEIKTAHIMVRSTAEDTDAKKADAKKRIDEVYELAKQGEQSFADLALKYSEDPGSSSKGGELPKFSSGKMVGEFEDAAFGLQKDGELSKPFKTQYGWHIVKRISYEPVASFDEMKGQLKSKIAKDSRAEITKKSFIAQLKKSYNYAEFEKNKQKILKKGYLNNDLFSKGTAVNDTVLRSMAKLGEIELDGKTYDRTLSAVVKNGAHINIRSRQYGEISESIDDTVVVRQMSRGWAYDKSKSKKLMKPVFVLDGKSFTQKTFLDYVERTQRNGTVPVGDWQEQYMNDKFDAWVEEQVVKYENSRLEAKYPEFAMLMKEYRDGILLFELTDEKVWSKAVSDSTGLMAYRDAHKEEFMWPKRWIATNFKCADDKVAKTVRKMLARNKPHAEILEKVNAKTSLALSIESGTYDADEKPFLAKISETGLSENMVLDGQVVFSEVSDVLEAKPKELDEARGMITAAYQDYLEAEWIKELRAKYAYSVNKEVLYSIK